MDYQHLVTELIRTQKNMMRTLEDFDHNGKLPHCLKEAMTGACDWEDIVDGKGGLEQAPSAELVERFAAELADHAGLFDDYMREQIAKYCELAQQLPEAMMAPLA